MDKEVRKHHDFQISPAESGQLVQRVREKAILYLGNTAAGEPNNDIATERESPKRPVLDETEVE